MKARRPCAPALPHNSAPESRPAASRQWPPSQPAAQLRSTIRAKKSLSATRPPDSPTNSASTLLYRRHPDSARHRASHEELESSGNSTAPKLVKPPHRDLAGIGGALSRAHSRIDARKGTHYGRDGQARIRRNGPGKAEEN